MQLELPFAAAARPSPKELRARVIERGRDLLARARAHWPAAEIPDVQVEFRVRGRAAGEACSRTAVANYNAELLEKYADDFIAEIVPHEIAHVVAGRVFPGRIRPHGAEWRAVMALFGARASVTHCFETTPARRTGRVPYRCRCAEPHLLTERAHRRIRRGTVEYSCRICRVKLTYAGPARKRQSRSGASGSTGRRQSVACTARRGSDAAGETRKRPDARARCRCHGSGRTSG